MNERIQELYMQAIEYADSRVPAERRYNDIYYAIVSAKHAELIVGECAQAFEAEVDTWKEMDPYQGSMKRKGTQAIKQHFGVEE
jgi:hypothetical protein